MTTTFDEKGEPKRIRTEDPLLTSLTPYRQRPNRLSTEGQSCRTSRGLSSIYLRSLLLLCVCASFERLVGYLVCLFESLSHWLSQIKLFSLVSVSVSVQSLNDGWVSFSLLPEAMFSSTETPFLNSWRLEQHTDAQACNVHAASDRIATQRVALAAQSLMWLSACSAGWETLLCWRQKWFLPHNWWRHENKSALGACRCLHKTISVLIAFVWSLTVLQMHRFRRWRS